MTLENLNLKVIVDLQYNKYNCILHLCNIYIYLILLHFVLNLLLSPWVHFHTSVWMFGFCGCEKLCEKVLLFYAPAAPPLT